MCAIAGNVESVRVLLSLECNVTCVDNEQHTAVHWAAGTHLHRYKQVAPGTRGKKLLFSGVDTKFRISHIY